MIESAGSAWKYCIGRGITLAKVLIAAMAFATLETEGYGQFVGSIQRAFPHDEPIRHGGQGSAFISAFLARQYSSFKVKMCLPLKNMELDSDGDKSAGPCAL